MIVKPPPVRLTYRPILEKRVLLVPVEPTKDIQEKIWLAAQLQNANAQYKAMTQAVDTDKLIEDIVG